ncbi:MAG: lysoplasmalogenase [Chromatiales bacterium]|nr:lysoplasmalogenase [Chromatiales bacterium]MDH4031875.1 lysoplasmalogenase [Chromatiales bacterium]
MSAALLVAAGISGLLHIRADYQRQWALTYIYKPLTMLLILGLALQGGQPDPYRFAIVTGLILSLVGDVFLMLKPARFLPGLTAFLFAHLAYLVGFAYASQGLHLIASAIALLTGLIMLRLLWPGLGRLWLPVTLYVAAIVAMVAAAFSAALEAPSAYRLAAAAGALAFLISDATLGVARFRKPFEAAQALILSSYYLGQSLIALSAGSLYS